MLVRPDALGHAPCLVEIRHRLTALVGGFVYAGEGDERVQRVPFVLGFLHHPVGFLVFRRGLVILPRFFVEGTEIGVAERDAERAARLRVQCHRLAVIHPCRVRLSPMLEDGAEVGVVDGLPQGAVQFRFAFQCHAQHAVGTFEVAQRHVDVAQSVERHHPVLPGRERSVVAFLTQLPRAVVIVLRHVEHPHAAVVGADVVQGLHPFYGVADGFGLPQSLAVGAQRLLEAALVAQLFAQFPQGDDAAEPVALAFQSLLQQGEGVGSTGGAHDAVRRPAFVGGGTSWFPTA